MSKFIRLVECQNGIPRFRIRSASVYQQCIPKNHYRTAVSNATSRRKDANKSSNPQSAWLDRTRKLLEQQNEEHSMQIYVGRDAPSFVSSSRNVTTSQPSSSLMDELDSTIQYWLLQCPKLVNAPSVEAFQTLWQLVFDVAIPHTNERNLPKVRGWLNILLSHWISYNQAPALNTGPYTAVAVWEKLQSLEDLPDATTFSIFLSGIPMDETTTSTGAATNAAIEIDPEDVLNYMMQSPYPQQHPGASVWDSALSVWGERAKNYSRYPNATERAKQVFDRMIGFGYKPTEVSLTIILNALSYRVHLPQSDCLEQAESIFLNEQYNHICSHNVQCNAIMLGAYCRSFRSNGVGIAFDFLCDMISNFFDYWNQVSVDQPDLGIPPTPSWMCFRVVVSGLANRGEPPESIVMLLRELQNLYVLCDENIVFDPSKISMPDVMGTYISSGHPDLAEQLLHLLFEEHFLTTTGDISTKAQYISEQGAMFYQPDTALIDMCLRGWAESDRADAAERAAALFHHCFMNKDINSLSEDLSLLHLLPSKHSYWYVLKAMSKSKQPGAAERSEAILKHMWNEYDLNVYEQHARSMDNSDSTVGRQPTRIGAAASLSQRSEHKPPLKPDLRHYQEVFEAWSQAPLDGDASATTRAVALYQDMLFRGLKPTTNEILFSLILTLSCVKTKKGNILQGIIDGYRNSSSQGPTISHTEFHSCMLNWINSKHADAPVRVWALLNSMQELSQANGWNCSPNAKSYELAMLSWVKSHRDDAAEQAEMILREMMACSPDGRDPKKANRQCYQFALDAWSKSNRPDSHLRTQLLFNEMADRYDRKGDIAAKPVARCYAAVMLAWARSRHPDAPVRAQSLLEELSGRYERTDDKAFKPLLSCYKAVMNAWSWSHHEDAPYRAQSLLTEMLDRYEHHDDKALKPDSFRYAVVMNLWAQSDDPDAPLHAQSLFDEMLARYEGTEDKSFKPRPVCYAAVMNAWNGSNLPNALNRVVALFDELRTRHLRTGDDDFAPDSDVYSALLKAWAKSCCEESSKRALDIVKEMEESDRNHLSNERASKHLPSQDHYAVVIRLFVGIQDLQTAEVLLKRMIDRFDGKVMLKYRCCFDLILDAYRELNLPDAAHKIEALTDEMNQVEFIDHRQNDGTLW